MLTSQNNLSRAAAGIQDIPGSNSSRHLPTAWTRHTLPFHSFMFGRQGDFSVMPIRIPFPTLLLVPNRLPISPSSCLSLLLHLSVGSQATSSVPPSVYNWLFFPVLCHPLLPHPMDQLIYKSQWCGGVLGSFIQPTQHNTFFSWCFKKGDPSKRLMDGKRALKIDFWGQAVACRQPPKWLCFV